MSILLNLYNLPQSLCVALSLLAVFGLLAQAMVLMVNANRLRRSQVRQAEDILEWAILLHLLLYSFLVAGAVSARRSGFVATGGFGAARWLSFSIVGIPACILACYRAFRRRRVTRRYRKWRRLLRDAAASVLVLPAVEMLAGQAYLLILCAVLLYWLIRAVRMCRRRYKRLRNRISRLSIKEAIDSLNTGLLFSEQDGFIVLINRRMLELMRGLTGAISQNGTEFFERLCRGDCLPECKQLELDDHLAYRLSDQSVWMFTRSTVEHGKKQYHQISATDVTARWNATVELRRQNSELDRRIGELHTAIKNLDILYREEETLRAKIRIHDMMGQRIAILIRALRENLRPDKALLTAFTDGLLTGLLDEEPAYQIERELEMMLDMYEGIGIHVTMHGRLPEISSYARVFTEIISERITAAVRDQSPREFSIAINRTGGGGEHAWVLTMEAQGSEAEKGLAESTRTGSVVRKLRALGGTLHVRSDPCFLLVASIPERGTQENEENA